MKYDFTTVLDRSNTASTKWLDMKQQNPNVPQGIVPLSTADMEFKNPPEIIEGLKSYLDNNVLGYATANEAYSDSVINWMKRKHDYEIKKDWIISTAGIIPGLFAMVKAYTNPGDGVLIMSPVYYPFRYAAFMTSRNLVETSLINNDGHYEIDFEDLDRKTQDPANKVLIFCSPHNPVGRVWTKEELKKMMDICIKNDVFVISDEIHHDLIMPGHTHTVLANISPEAANNCAICTAPSKTFNIAGLHGSNIIIENKEKRDLLFNELMTNFAFFLNTMAYESCKIAYNECEEWLNELLTVIDGNRQYMENFFKENIPEVKVSKLEGTYLLWTDFSALPITHKDLEKIFKNDALLYVDEGYVFGPEGRGFERFNIACPLSVLEDAMERLLVAINKHKEDWKTNGIPVRVTLEENKKMEDFIYNTPFEKDLRLSENLNNKKTFILFLRYYGCTLCQYDLHLIKEGYSKIIEAGGQVKVVLQSAPEIIANDIKNSEAFPFEIICDPEMKLYEKYKVFTADDMYTMGGGNTVPKATEAAVKGFVHGEYEGEETQLPAAVLIDENMMIKYVKYGENLADIPSVEEMASLI